MFRDDLLSTPLFLCHFPESLRLVDMPETAVLDRTSLMANLWRRKRVAAVNVQRRKTKRRRQGKDRARELLQERQGHGFHSDVRSDSDAGPTENFG